MVTWKQASKKLTWFSNKPIRCRFVHQSYMEPHSVTAFWDRPGHVTLWEPVQGAFFRPQLHFSHAGHPPEQRYHPHHRDWRRVWREESKGLFAPIAALLARKARRPVQLGPDSPRRAACADPAPHSVIHLKTGVRRDGTLTAIEGEILVDAGAFPSG